MVCVCVSELKASGPSATGRVCSKVQTNFEEAGVPLELVDFGVNDRELPPRKIRVVAVVGSNLEILGENLRHLFFEKPD